LLVFVVDDDSQVSSHEDCGFPWFAYRTDDFVLDPHAFCLVHGLEGGFAICEFNDHWG
jgi:hypothetical protein